MKRFDQFIKEEIDLRGNKGVPDDFMRKSEQEAERNLGLRIDDESQMRQYGPQIMQLIGQSQRFLSVDSNGQRLAPQQMEERFVKLEKLAHDVVMSKYGEVIDLAIPNTPFELKINLLRPGQSVIGEIDKLRSVPKNAEQPTEEEPQEEEEQDSQDQEEQDNDSAEPEDHTSGDSIFDSVEKKKLLNMMTQAAGKATKDLIKASDEVDNGLREIFGDSFRTILNVWTQTSDVADKMDWIIPVNRKASMMKDSPGGMAGAVELKWESLSGQFYDIKLLLEKEATKIVVNAVGIDFPMLLHEAIKGVFLLLQSKAIKSDKETAKKIKKATSSFMDEAQDFRYGPPALQKLINFVNKFPESNESNELSSKVFHYLAIDKDRAKKEAEQFKDNQAAQDLAKLAYTDKEFLEIMKSMFSVFDSAERGGKIEYVVNEERFNDSKAKKDIQKIIDYIIKLEKEIEQYNKDLEEWKRNRDEDTKYRQQQQEEKERGETVEPGQEEEESDIDKLVKQSLYGGGEEKTSGEVDYSELTPRELTELIDDALDAGDYERVKMLSQYMKEGKEIYLKELERINESHISHNRRK
jgi:hypothetical protein